MRKTEHILESTTCEDEEDAESTTEDEEDAEPTVEAEEDAESTTEDEEESSEVSDEEIRQPPTSINEFWNGFDWADLTAAEQEALSVLGWDEESWDEGGYGFSTKSKNPYPPQKGRFCGASSLQTSQKACVAPHQKGMMALVCTKLR